jgi:hypothetical protein
MISTRNRSAVSHVRRKIPFDARFFGAAEWRIGQDHVDHVARAIVSERSRQGVVVADQRRYLDAVQHHIRDAQQVRQLLLFDTVDRVLHHDVILDAPTLRFQVLERARQKTAGAARRIQDALAKPRVDLVNHELRHSAWRIKLPRVAGALQVLEDPLIQVVEQMPVGAVIEVDLGDPVDHLAQQLAGLHVVVRVAEHLAGHEAARIALRIRIERLERRKQVGVHERQQFIAGDALWVGRPVAPAQPFGQRRPIGVAHQFELGFLVVENLQEQQPGQLRDPLRVAVDAGVLAHDVLHGLDEGGADCHE